MKLEFIRLTVLSVLLACPLFPPTANAESLKTQNVFLIVSDGLRWQEVFQGVDARLINKENGSVEDTNALRAKFWRDNPEARREALMPFFWNVIAKEGQLFGNQEKGSLAAVSNGKKFSYPGYNEMATGFGDPKVDSNDKKLNANTNVFEWLESRETLRGKAAILGTWDVFPYIFNIQRSHLPIWPAWEPQFSPWEIHPPALVTNLMADTPSVLGVAYDSFLYQAVVDHMKTAKPRVVFVGFGETDEWAHRGDYQQYVDSAHRVDDFVRRLWTTAQSMDAYRGKTTFILTADHGRGSGLKSWQDHGEAVKESDGVWIAVIGPDTRALGERSQSSPVTSSQIAATIAALLGEDFNKPFPGTGKPIADVIGKGETR